MNHKSLIKKIFNVFGYNIAKNHDSGPCVSPLPVTTFADSEITIGRFSVIAPGNHPIRSCLASFPVYMAQLARITKAFYSESSDLVAIDVGSNIGDSLCLIKSGADIPVICIEGDPMALGYLRNNSRQFTYIAIIDTFLSEQTETKSIDVTNTGWNCSLLPVSGPSGQPVRFSSLSDVMRTLPIRCKSVLLKIDVEGYEPMVVKGSLEFLKKIQPVIMLEYNFEALSSTKQDGPGMLDTLSDLGYGPVIVYDNRGLYLFSGLLTDEIFRAEINLYAQSPYRNIPYYDLLMFPRDKQYLYESFRSDELAPYLHHKYSASSL